jgi:hypothetical protein
MRDRLKEEDLYIFLKKSKIDKDTQDNFLLIHSFYYPFLITNDYNYTFKEDCDNNSSYLWRWIDFVLQQWSRAWHCASIYSDSSMYNFV